MTPIPCQLFRGLLFVSPFLRKTFGRTDFHPDPSPLVNRFVRLTPDFILNKVQGRKPFGNLP